jgi:ribosomal protein L33
LKEYCPVCNRVVEVTQESGLERVTVDFDTLYIELEQIYCTQCNEKLYSEEQNYRNGLLIRDTYNKLKQL